MENYKGNLCFYLLNTIQLKIYTCFKTGFRFSLFRHCLNMAVVMEGICNTANYAGIAFTRDQVAETFVMRNQNVFPLTQDEAFTRITALVTLGRYLRGGQGTISREMLLAVVAGELMVDGLPADQYLNQRDANTRVYHAVREVSQGRGLANISLANYLQSRPTGLARNVDPPLAGAAAAAAPAADDPAVVHALYDREVVPYMAWAILRMPINLVISPLDIIIHTYVAMAKRGTISEGFAQKVAGGVQTEINRDVEISSESCRIIYNLYGKGITADNCEATFDRWLAKLPVNCMRLKLTLNQTACSGLTAFVVIGRAMRLYPRFDWAKIAQLYPDEIANFQAALTAVAGNAYYGFNKDLGAAKSTNFRNLAHVAKELLIRLNGDGSLRQYRGWVKVVKYVAKVTEMINAYEAAHLANLEAEAPLIEDVNTVTAVRLAVQGGQYANMFV